MNKEDFLKNFGIEKDNATRLELSAALEIFSKALSHFTKQGDVIEVKAHDKFYAIHDVGGKFEVFMIPQNED